MNDIRDGIGTGDDDSDESCEDNDNTLRRDYLYYLLSEAEGALKRALPELSQDEAASVAARLSALATYATRGAMPE